MMLCVLLIDIDTLPTSSQAIDLVDEAGAKVQMEY